MAKDNINVADMTIEDLAQELTSLTNDYRQMKFDHAVKGLGNPMELRSLRREIARINTEMRARELAEMTPDQIEMRSKLRARRRRQR
jgi:large subunit ribosomal protein L29